MLKYLFPGCSEFSLEAFWELPYEYILEAVSASTELRRRELHELERPIALSMLQVAEANRDNKKRKTPYKIQDFCLYADPGDEAVPEARYGAAANELISLNKMPLWALFIYPELKKKASNATVPEPVAFFSDHAILLAPVCQDGNCRGMLIAEKEASGRTVEFKTIDDKIVYLRIPSFDPAVYADEEAMLGIM